MTIRFEISDKDRRKFGDRLEKLEASIQNEIEKGLQSSANRLRNEIIKSFNEPKSGKTYTRGTITHRASAPGEPPAVDTGDLRSSINIFPDFKNLSIEVAPTATGEKARKKALSLEYGTSKMAPRPFMRPAADKTSTAIAKIMATSYKRGVQNV